MIKGFIEIGRFAEQVREAKAQFTGFIGESVFNAVARTNLGHDYHIMSDVVLKARGGTTQIDQIILSKYAIFVVEI